MAEQESAAVQAILDIEACHAKTIHQTHLQAVRNKATASRHGPMDACQSKP